MKTISCSVSQAVLQHSTMKRATRSRTRTRLMFDPMESLTLINAELRSRNRRLQKGALRLLLTEAVIHTFGPKHPKLVPECLSLFLPKPMGSLPTERMNITQP